MKRTTSLLFHEHETLLNGKTNQLRGLKRRKNVNAKPNYSDLILHILCFPTSPKIVYLNVLCLHVCLCTILVSGLCAGQKRVSEPLQIELHVVGSCLMGAGN